MKNATSSLEAKTTVTKFKYLPCKWQHYYKWSYLTTFKISIRNKMKQQWK